MRLGSLLVDATAPLRRLRRRAPLLERLLQVSLTDAELASVEHACRRSGVALGAYYHWYLQKLLVSRQVRGLEKASTLALIARMDRSDYARVDALRAERRGLVVAVPHHGHYILSIVALAERLRASRRVLIFYGDPRTHAGNAVFDHLYGQLFGDAASGVEVVHDTRAGLARALRGLKEGAAVIIMPDVHKHEHDTYVVPFCGRPLNVMLGTAALAHRTGALVLPMVSAPTPRGFAFESVFGERLDPGADAAAAADDDPVHARYRLTAEVFRQLEAVMDPTLFAWQYVRAHALRDATFPTLTPASVESIAALFFQDPRVDVGPRAALSLD